MSKAITQAEKPLLVFWLMTMTLLGVFPLDVVLPSFPALAEHFHTSTTHIARSVSLFAIGFSCSMLLIGPLSDRIGRKKLLLA
ncbi:MFS transporter, partial [Pseudomonas orientalis]